MTSTATKTNHPDHGLSESQLAGIEAEAKRTGVLGVYQHMVREGTSPRMALMLACQQSPTIKGTDSKYWQLERDRFQSDYSEEEMDNIVKIARKAGINTAGKTYQGQLGKYDDPKAWVSDTHDIRLSAKDKGLSLRGQVNVENTPKTRKKPRLSKRITNEAAAEYMKRDPALAEKVKKNPTAMRDLKESIKEKHGTRKKD